MPPLYHICISFEDLQAVPHCTLDPPCASIAPCQRQRPLCPLASAWPSLSSPFPTAPSAWSDCRTRTTLFMYISANCSCCFSTEYPGEDDAHGGRMAAAARLGPLRMLPCLTSSLPLRHQLVDDPGSLSIQFRPQAWFCPRCSRRALSDAVVCCAGMGRPEWQLAARVCLAVGFSPHLAVVLCRCASFLAVSAVAQLEPAQSGAKSSLKELSGISKDQTAKQEASACAGRVPRRLARL